MHRVVKQSALGGHDPVLGNQVNNDLRVYWELKVFKELLVDGIAFLKCMQDVLVQSMPPLFIFIRLIFDFDEIKLDNAKNLLHLCDVSFVDRLLEHLEQFFGGVLDQHFS